MKKPFLIFLSIAAIMAAMSFRNISIKHCLTLHFSNSVGNKTLIADTVYYKNKAGQQYTVTNFKYYISNVRVTDMSGKVFENKNSYYLIRMDEPATMDAALEDIPAEDYKSISFTIGVDSLHNCSGAQSGALDPINGMFWTWNTGYIFFKLEGKSPASKSPGNIFEYHIGGYREPTNFIRHVTLDLTGPSIMPHRVNAKMETDPDAKLKITDIHINADVDKVMNGKTAIDLSKLSSVTDFHNADKIADNYQQMFNLSYLEYDY